MTPTPIDPKDIRLGDVVRTTFTVTSVRDGYFGNSRASFGCEPNDCLAPDPELTWELVARPREPGSFWQDPVTGVVYVKTDEDDGPTWFATYRAFRNRKEDAGVQAELLAHPTFARDHAVIARLIPWEQR